MQVVCFIEGCTTRTAGIRRTATSRWPNRAKSRTRRVNAHPRPQAASCPPVGLLQGRIIVLIEAARAALWSRFVGAMTRLYPARPPSPRATLPSAEQRN